MQRFNPLRELERRSKLGDRWASTPENPADDKRMPDLVNLLRDRSIPIQSGVLDLHRDGLINRFFRAFIQEAFERGSEVVLVSPADFNTHHGLELGVSDRASGVVDCLVSELGLLVVELVERDNLRACGSSGIISGPEWLEDPCAKVFNTAPAEEAHAQCHSRRAQAGTDGVAQRALVLLLVTHRLRKLAVNGNVVRAGRTGEGGGKQRGVRAYGTHLGGDVYPQPFEGGDHLSLVANLGCGLDGGSSGLIGERCGVLRGGKGNASGSASCCGFQCNKGSARTSGQQDVSCNLRDGLKDLEAQTILVTHQTGVLLPVGLVLVHGDKGFGALLRTEQRANPQRDGSDRVADATAKLLQPLGEPAVVGALLGNPFLNKRRITHAGGLRLCISRGRIVIVLHDQPLQGRGLRLKHVDAVSGGNSLLVVVEARSIEGQIELILICNKGLRKDRIAQAVGSDSGFRFVGPIRRTGTAQHVIGSEPLDVLL